MSLEHFIDIRFADPVLSLSMNSYGLLYGSSIGRILFYTFHSQQETVIAEFSEECIRAVYVSKDNSLFIAIGDRYCIGMTSPSSHKQLVHHDCPHSDELCLSTQVFMKHDLVCVVPLSETNAEGLILTQISTHSKKKYPLLPFKQHSVPYDFDGDRLLWMEWDGSERLFKYFDFEQTEAIEIRRFSRNYGQIGLCRLMGPSMLIVRDFRTIETIDIRTGELSQSIGKCASDVVAVCWIKVKEKHMGKSDQSRAENQNEEKFIIITVEYNCIICFWDQQGMVCSYNITEFAELTQEYRQPLYFTMGYPYYVIVHERRIAFSTDVGVLVAHLPYLSQVTIISS